MKKIILSILSLFCSTQIFAAPHTFHTIYSKNGNWTGSLRVIHEFDKAWFTEKDGITRIEKPFEITPTTTKQFGFDFASDVTFNVAYTLVLTPTESFSQAPQFSNKACVFVITAPAPAVPDLKVISYGKDTQCSYVDTGHGEDFYVS
jgi:hypothetical protein